MTASLASPTCPRERPHPAATLWPLAAAARGPAVMDSVPAGRLPMGRAMNRILVVEDSFDAQELISCALEGDYEVTFATSLDECHNQLDRDHPDLILLDLRLPDGSGFDVCASLQQRAGTRAIPIIFLTSCAETRNKVLAFSLGADDYVEKPFVPDELRARIAGRLRKRADPTRETIVFGPLRVEPARFRATVTTRSTTRILDLTPHELRLLAELARRTGEVASRSDLFDAIWRDVAVSSRTLNSHVSNLRRKLGADAPLVEAVRGVGYRLRWPI